MKLPRWFSRNRLRLYATDLSMAAIFGACLSMFFGKPITAIVLVACGAVLASIGKDNQYE